MKRYCVRLKDAHGESANSVVSLDACAIRILDRDTGFAPSDVRHSSIQQQPGIIFCEESGRLATDESIVSALVVDKIIDFGKSIISRVLEAMSSPNKIYDDWVQPTKFATVNSCELTS